MSRFLLSTTSTCWSLHASKKVSAHFSPQPIPQHLLKLCSESYVLLFGLCIIKKSVLVHFSTRNRTMCLFKIVPTIHDPWHICLHFCNILWQHEYRKKMSQTSWILKGFSWPNLTKHLPSSVPTTERPGVIPKQHGDSGREPTLARLLRRLLDLLRSGVRWGPGKSPVFLRGPGSHSRYFGMNFRWKIGVNPSIFGHFVG